jgi:Tfp pilus assembly protein PilN
MPKSKFINLLPQEEFEASTLGRVLRWAMGTFRIIVIMTEMVVMAAFLSRFWLDAQNSDLTNNIKIATAQIEVQSDFEKEFRGIQKKLNILKEIKAGAKDSERVISVADRTPNEVSLTSIIFRGATGEIHGTSETETAISQFISNLKTDTTIKKIVLGSLETSEESQSKITFQLNISY